MGGLHTPPALSRVRTWGLDLACHPQAHCQVQAKLNTHSEPLLWLCPAHTTRCDAVPVQAPWVGTDT